MAKAKKMFFISMVTDADTLYDVTAAAEGRSFDLQIRPVAPAPQAGSSANGSAEKTTRVPVKTILYPWALKQKQFDVKDAILALGEHGITKGAVYTAILTAMKEGLLERPEPGFYKVLPAMRKASIGHGNGADKTSALNAAKGAAQRHEIPHKDFILRLIKDGTNTYKGLLQAMEADGRARRSIDGALGKLRELKMIGGDGQGTYKMLAKGIEHLKA